VNDPSGGDQTPFFREDGQVLYFASSRVAANGNDIYRSQRDGSEFQPPVVVDELNTRYNEVGPAATPDDLTIYFASARPGAMGDMDIYVATRQSKSGRFSHVRPVTELNTPAVEIPSFVTRDNCTLYFYSDRDRALTIYVATRPAG
jgi:Tol biopolymer transport system component